MNRSAPHAPHLRPKNSRRIASSDTLRERGEELPSSLLAVESLGRDFSYPFFPAPELPPAPPSLPAPVSPAAAMPALLH